MAGPKIKKIPGHLRNQPGFIIPNPGDVVITKRPQTSEEFPVRIPKVGYKDDKAVPKTLSGKIKGSAAHPILNFKINRKGQRSI